MTENNTAQPGQDDIAARLRENADLDAAEGGNPAVIRLERDAADEIDRLRALLSKLRAEGVQAGDERDAARYRVLRSHIAPLRLAESMGIPRKQVKRSDDPAARVDEMCDAALASAPVAGEAQPDRQAVIEAIHRYGNARAMAEHNIAYRDEVRNTYDALIALFDAAPQASEAVCSCPSGDGSLRHPCAVHPQASEAVRDAGNATSEDHMRPDLDRGVPGSFTAFSQWVMNQPNDQIYVHSAQEGFLAGVEWSRQQRTGVCLPEYLNDLRYHDQYRIGWNRCLEVCRAALSAQPGAQKKEQSDAG